MKVSSQKIIIRSEDIYDYWAKHGNLTLYVDPMFKPGQRKIVTGEVVDVCDTMESWNKISPDILVGDKLYFHYNALKEDNAIPDKSGLWVIDYDTVFCAVRGGQIVMIGGRILAEPIFDNDIVDIDVDGFKHKAKLTSSGLVKELDPGHNMNKAKLMHIGKPRIGDPEVDIKVGDVFYYIKNGDFKNTIEGKEYFVMYQDEILAVDE
jgi:co-chaperonin GroES (HSP10)